MNKLLVFILVILSMLVSCNRTGNSSKTRSNSSLIDVKYPVITEDTLMTSMGCEGMVVNISKTSNPLQLQLVMTNNSEYSAFYGVDWILYTRKDSSWVVCEPNFIFEDIGRAMYPDQKDTLYIPLNQFKKPLESGSYKLVKDITLNNKDCTLTKYFKMEL